MTLLTMSGPFHCVTSLTFLRHLFCFMVLFKLNSNVPSLVFRPTMARSLSIMPYDHFWPLRAWACAWLAPIHHSRTVKLSVFFVLSMIACERCCCTPVHHSPFGPTCLPLQLTCSIVGHVAPAMISPHISCSSVFHWITHICVFLVAVANHRHCSAQTLGMLTAMHLPWLPC
jgi:hypothetical protein